MAIQSTFYTGTALETRTFPSTKHIATKQHMAVWRQEIVAPQNWVQMDISEYQLINNACVLNTLLSTTLYSDLEVRVADAPDELVSSPSDITIVAGIEAEIVIVAGIETEVVAVADIETEVVTVAGVETEILAIYSNLTEILEADLRAWEAEAEALTADSYATEAEDTEVNVVTSDGDGTFTYTPQTGVYSALHHAAKAATFNPALYALLTGAVFTGQVKGIAPVSAEDLTRKDYVDAKPTFKNLFTNGTLLSKQEGIPTGITTTLTYFYDVLSTLASTGVIDVSEQKTDGNAESVRLTHSTATTDLTGINLSQGAQCRQFQLQNFAHLKDEDVTLQVKFKASQTGNYSIALRDTTSTDSYVTTFNYPTADTEQLVPFTISLDSTKLDFTIADNAMIFDLIIGADNNGTYQLADASKDSWQTGNYMTTDACVNWSATLNAYIQIGDIQIEEGTEVTAVERLDKAINLVRCEDVYEEDTIQLSHAVCRKLSSASRASHKMDFKTTKRDTAVVTLSDITHIAGDGTPTSLTAASTSKTGFRVNQGGSGFISETSYVSFKYKSDARL